MMSTSRTVEAFREIITKSPEVSVPVAAIRALTVHIEQSQAMTMQEFTKELNAATQAIKDATQQCISVCAGCELFERFAMRSGTDALEDFEPFKRRLADKARAFCERSSQCRERICALALEFITDGSCILMHSYSRVVMCLLLRAAALNKRFSVLVTESRPNSRGYAAARTLQQNDIPARVILDSAVGYYMGKADLVLSGAEGVVENGGIVNQIGTYGVAVMAKTAGVPFYAVAESYKFVRCFPLDQYDLPSSMSGNCLFGANELQALTPQDQPLVMPEHPSLDYTPPDFISLLFTDCGILTPSAVSDELIKLYY
jgi:translation initiation factor eIF-2B subunit alpha